MRSGYMDFHPTETAEPSCSASKKFRIRAQKLPQWSEEFASLEKAVKFRAQKKGGTRVRAAACRSATCRAQTLKAVWHRWAALSFGAVENPTITSVGRF
jgi:hypothetical protein